MKPSPENNGNVTSRPLLPADILLHLYHFLFEIPDFQSDNMIRARSQAKMNMLVLNKDMYKMLAPVFYRKAKFFFDSPQTLINNILPTTSKRCLQSIQHISYRTEIDEERSHVSKYSETAAELEMVARILFEIRKLPALKTIEIDFDTYDEPELESERQYNPELHSLNVEGWWKYFDEVAYDFFSRIEAHLSHHLSDYSITHYVELDQREAEGEDDYGDRYVIPRGEKAPKTSSFVSLKHAYIRISGTEASSSAVP